MKKIFQYIISLFVLCGLLSSCISSEQTNYLQDIKADYSFRPFEEYILRAGDNVSCNISSQDRDITNVFNTLVTSESGSTAAKSFEIYNDGTIIIPYFGTIKIAGLTIQQAELVIQKKVQESITDAQVQLTMANNFFYILSKDKRGMFYVYKDNMTIYQALAISGQTTERMDLTKVTIVRKDMDGNTITKQFDLRAADVVQSEFYYIQPNDLIYFPTNKNSFFNVTSIGSFLSTITGPLAILLYAITL